MGVEHYGKAVKSFRLLHVFTQQMSWQDHVNILYSKICLTATDKPAAQHNIIRK